MKQKILSIIMVIVVAFNTIAIPASAETLTLSKPESISLVQKTESTIKIEWPTVKNADKYQVYYSTDKNGTYNKTTEGSANIEKITVFGDAFTKTDTEIVLRYKADKVYNLFSENNTGLFKLVVLPEMLLNDVNVVIESSASNVVGLLPSGKLSNYRIELSDY